MGVTQRAAEATHDELWRRSRYNLTGTYVRDIRSLVRRQLKDTTQV